MTLRKSILLTQYFWSDRPLAFTPAQPQYLPYLKLSPILNYPYYQPFLSQLPPGASRPPSWYYNP